MNLGFFSNIITLINEKINNSKSITVSIETPGKMNCIINSTVYTMFSDSESIQLQLHDGIITIFTDEVKSISYDQYEDEYTISFDNDTLMTIM